MKFLLLSFILIFSCTDPGKMSGQKDTKSDGNTVNFQNISKFKLPEKLDFCGEPVPLDIPEVKERAEREFYLLLQQPGQIILYLKRSGRYFPMYEKILKENDMPDDLKYLSVAESALYMAHSHVGAVGLWQFMKGTAKLMGLHVSVYVDERRHPEKSTRAACKYLKQGYNFLGSWTLAAGGYNMGHTNIDFSKDFQKGENYYDLFLNEETSRFLFRIILIKEIMQNAEKYGIRLSEDEIYKPYQTKIITWNNSIPSLTDWAKEHGTTYKDVKLLNPWILKRKLRAPLHGKSYEIAIPSD